jgi:hypothetical protein
LARESLAWNLRDETFVALFPHYKKIYEERKVAEEKGYTLISLHASIVIAGMLMRTLVCTWMLAIAEAKAKGLPLPESSEPSGWVRTGLHDG